MATKRQRKEEAARTQVIDAARELFDSALDLGETGIDYEDGEFSDWKRLRLALEELDAC